MKLKHISVGIGSLKDGLNDFERVIGNIERGRPQNPRTPSIHFVSLDAMNNVLSPRRIELLKIIRERTPHSLYALAKMAERDMKNVHDDVGLLTRLGFVQVTHQRAHRRQVVPRVNYDELRVNYIFAHRTYLQPA